MGLFGGGLTRSDLAEIEKSLPVLQEVCERARMRLRKFFPEGQEDAGELAALVWASCYSEVKTFERAKAGHKPTIAGLKEAMKMFDSEGRRIK